MFDILRLVGTFVGVQTEPGEDKFVSWGQLQLTNGFFHLVGGEVSVAPTFTESEVVDVRRKIPTVIVLNRGDAISPEWANRQKKDGCVQPPYPE